MRRLSFCPPPQHFFLQLSTVLHISLSHSLLVSISVSFSLLSLSLLITDRDKSSGLLAFSSSSEKKGEGGGEGGGGGRRRKAPLSVPLLLLRGTGRTKAFPDRPDRPYLYPTDVSSPCVLTILPRTLFSLCHKPPCLIRITQFVGISVWCVEEEIARQRLMLSVITLCGCDYMFMCIWVLHVDQHVARLSLSNHCSDFREVGNLPYASPTTRLSSVFQCDVTIMVERQTCSLPSNDPLQKFIHSECCRGYNIDAIDTVHTGIKDEKSATKRIYDHHYRQSDLMGMCCLCSFSSSHTFQFGSLHRKEKIHFRSIIEKTYDPP